MKFKAWIDKHGKLLGMAWIFLPTAGADPIFDHASNHWAVLVLLAGQIYCFWYSWLRFVEVRWTE